MQRGIDTPDMDVRWVSSLSWYFLNWFGLNGLYRLILGDGNGEWFFIFILLPDWSVSLITAAVEQKDLASSPFAGAAGAAGTPGQPQDFNKIFTGESENLQLAQGIYKWVGDDIDQRILKRYGKI